MKTYCLSVALFLALPVVSHAQRGAPLRLVQTIPLPDLKEGDFDHFAVDLEGHRLFLTAEANGVVEVFDTLANKLIHTIPDSSSRAMRSPLLRSDVHTDAPRPNSLSLASRSASSSESTTTIGSTGPKISSRMIRMSGVTPVRTVGA